MREQWQGMLLDELEGIAEKQLQEVINHFQNLPEPVLLRPPKDGGWNITECFEHLNSYADFYLLRMKKAVEKTPFVSGDLRFKYSVLGLYFIRLMDPQLPSKKMKAMKKHLPLKSKDPHQVIAQFIQHMEELLLLSKQCREYDLKRMRIATSISSFIRMNGGDVLHFLLVHNERHIGQARKLLAVIS